MPSSISSFAEFDRRLGDALSAMDTLLAKYPERELLSIKKQLEAVFSWTRGGQQPTQDQKDSLNFGLLASRYVHELDSKVAENLYELASYITYW